MVESSGYDTGSARLGRGRLSQAQPGLVEGRFLCVKYSHDRQINVRPATFVDHAVGKSTLPVLCSGADIRRASGRPVLS